MKEFKLTAQFTISGYTTVKAETLQGAIEIAKNRLNADIFCDNTTNESEVWVFDAIDGEPLNIIEESSIEE
ncbi:MAG: hypothetical protein PHS93_10185 [Candidatus Omnitrophica bacterium]|nr:hypothetical protein [Candidatus Omnitrophota bacterium]MDD5353518.1 hypothetical protein [Candidatus Omnitrophota bacterium]